MRRRLFALLSSTPGPTYCHRCGAANPPDAKYCQQCGGMLNP